MTKIDNRNIPLLLLRARESMMVHFRPILGKYQITEQQWRILRVLYDQTELEPRELCDQCCILSPSMAGILKRMEEMGVIVKTPSVVDKRRVLVKISESFISTVEVIMMENQDAYMKLATTFDTDLLESLVEQLDALIGKLEKSDI